MKTDSKMLAKLEEGDSIAAQSGVLLSIAEKLEEAKTLHCNLESLESALFKMHGMILVVAWELGRILAELKEEIGHGRWLLWLCSNFQELGKNDDRRRKNAERCMNLFRANPNWQNSANLDPESVRKFMWGYIPVKERLQLEGDEEIRPGLHHLTFVNQFSKYYRQLRNGHIEAFSVEIFRRETAPMVRGVAEIGGREWIAGVLESS